MSRCSLGAKLRTNRMLYEMLEGINYYVYLVVPFLVFNVWYLHVANYQTLRKSNETTEPYLNV